MVAAMAQCPAAGSHLMLPMRRMKLFYPRSLLLSRVTCLLYRARGVQDVVQ